MLQPHGGECTRGGRESEQLSIPRHAGAGPGRGLGVRRVGRRQEGKGGQIRVAQAHGLPEMVSVVSAESSCVARGDMTLAWENHGEFICEILTL